MAFEDFLSDLSGGFQGAGMGASILGGMEKAKIGWASNPWVAGGLLGGGALLGILGAEDPQTKRAARINERLGKQEVEMNNLAIRDKTTEQNLAMQRRQTWNQFGNLFSNYLGAMSQARGPA